MLIMIKERSQDQANWWEEANRGILKAFRGQKISRECHPGALVSWLIADFHK